MRESVGVVISKGLTSCGERRGEMMSRIRIGAGLAILVAVLLPCPAVGDLVFTTFDVSGAIATQPQGLNDAGQVVGYYLTPSFADHAFVRDPGGRITTFDVPGSD